MFDLKFKSGRHRYTIKGANSTLAVHHRDVTSVQIMHFSIGSNSLSTLTVSRPLLSFEALDKKNVKYAFITIYIKKKFKTEISNETTSVTRKL